MDGFSDKSHQIAASQDIFSGLLNNAGAALRHQLCNKLTPILLGCNQIQDSQTRLIIQACCLDIVTGVEDLIRTYGLDKTGHATSGGEFSC